MSHRRPLQQQTQGQFILWLLGNETANMAQYFQIRVAVNGEGARATTGNGTKCTISALWGGVAAPAGLASWRRRIHQARDRRPHPQTPTSPSLGPYPLSLSFSYFVLH